MNIPDKWFKSDYYKDMKIFTKAERWFNKLSPTGQLDAIFYAYLVHLKRNGEECEKEIEQLKKENDRIPFDKRSSNPKNDYLTDDEKKMPNEIKLLQYVLGIQSCKNKGDVVEILKEIQDDVVQQALSDLAKEIEKMEEPWEILIKRREVLKAIDSRRTA